MGPEPPCSVGSDPLIHPRILPFFSICLYFRSFCLLSFPPHDIPRGPEDRVNKVADRSRHSGRARYPPPAPRHRPVFPHREAGLGAEEGAPDTVQDPWVPHADPESSFPRLCPFPRPTPLGPGEHHTPGRDGFPRHLQRAPRLFAVRTLNPALVINVVYFD